MLQVRRVFYMVLGFTFPIFWVFHADGFLAVLYRPVQKLFATSSVGWPSLCTAGGTYLLAILLFEAAVRSRRDINPLWRSPRQPLLFDHESFLRDHCIKTEPDQLHPQELSGGREGSAQETDR